MKISYQYILIYSFFITLSNGVNGLISKHQQQHSVIKQQQGNNFKGACERISSSEAASLIIDAYCTKRSQKSGHSGLLLITSDASRGANRLSGLTSILREIRHLGDEEDSGCKPTLPQKKSKRHESQSSNGDSHRGVDQITVATRRIHTKNARDVSKSEIAAVALGIRTAINHVSTQNRQRILFLTDSTSVLDYFCNDDGNKNTGEMNYISSTLMNDPHFKAMQILIQDTKENTGDPTCSDYSDTLISMAKVKSNKIETDGFFDHDAADIMSSWVKCFSNKEMEKMYINSAAEKKFPNIDIAHSSKVNNPTGRSFIVPSLRKEDLEYLATSEIKTEPRVKKPQVVTKRERGERLERCKERIRKDLGISFLE